VCYIADRAALLSGSWFRAECNFGSYTHGFFFWLISELCYGGPRIFFPISYLKYYIYIYIYIGAVPVLYELELAPYSTKPETGNGPLCSLLMCCVVMYYAALP
jgi:hypothetical protein